MKFKFLILSFAMLFSVNVFSQLVPKNTNLNVGDSVTLSSCPAKGFRYIDYYLKTGFPYASDTSGYKQHVGDEFYDFFFTNGDFDAKILPCRFAGKTCRIIGLKIMEDKKTKEDIRVIFLELGKNMVAWVNLDLAAQSGEIYLQ
ncbi:MAG: hypothetical protein H7321_07450 [Bacteroidia bacterium]|nr:hypothetical protein [Bacteroidia bacterium]